MSGRNYFFFYVIKNLVIRKFLLWENVFIGFINRMFSSFENRRNLLLVLSEGLVSVVCEM